jgi:hypothetical protein
MALWNGPTVGRGMTSADLITSALDQPMSLGATLWDQAKGGVLESFGLGTVARETMLPPTLADQNSLVLADRIRSKNNEGTAISEDEFKASPSYRVGVPYDTGMTAERQAALAEMYDIKKAREFYAGKRPITAFIGNLAGQATDPINYVPFLGPATKAAAVARFGRIGGTALVASADAAINTAVAAGATAGARARFGDDVSWETSVSQIATAALIGGAFGTVAGAMGRRVDVRQDARVQEAEQRLATLRRTQEARVALNDAVQSLAIDGEVRLSPTSVDIVQRTAADVEASRTKLITMDYLYSVAKERQAQFAEAADSIARDLQIEFLNPGVKGRARAEEKFASKGYSSAAEMTDIVRGGFKVLTPEQADEAVARLSSRFRVTDEGWKTTPAGYFDRKAIIEFDDGVRAEVQLWHPELLAAKGARGGHKIYEMARSLPADDPRLPALYQQMRELYAEVRAALPDSWRGLFGSEGNALAKDLAETSSASMPTTTRLARSQAPPLNTNAALSSSTAGLPSQTAYSMGPTSEETIAAAARVGKAESIKDAASQYGVDPETGDFVEASELDALRNSGRLTEDEIRMLDEADQAKEAGDAFAEALKAAVGCML